MNRRLLLTGVERLSRKQADRLWRSFDIEARLPEATRVARTVEAWWPAILVALTHDVSNARTEGFNRVIKQTKRVGCGFRSQVNYQRPTANISSMNGSPPAKDQQLLSATEVPSRRMQSDRDDRRPVQSVLGGEQDVVGLSDAGFLVSNCSLGLPHGQIGGAHGEVAA